MSASHRFAKFVRLLAACCLVATLLVGCGADNGDSQTPEPPRGAASTSSATSEPAGDPAGEAGTLPVPSGGPKQIGEFPIPPGAEIVDLGPPFGQSWQFGLSSPDSAATVDFYKKTLAAQGYTLKEHVSLTVGANTVEYDLAFFGKTYGVVDANNLAGGTEVSVNDRPLRGLEP